MDFMGPFQGRTRTFFEGGRGQNRLLYVRYGLWKKKGLLHLCKVSTQASLPRLVKPLLSVNFQYVKGLEVPYDSVDCYKE